VILKLIKFTIPFLLLFFLTACKIDMDGDIYIGDVIDVSETNDIIYNPMNISFEMTSEETCERDKEKLSNILIKYFTNYNAKDCYSEDYNSYLRTGVDVPIMLDSEKDGAIAFSNSDLVSFTTVVRESDTQYIYDVYLSLNEMMFNALNEEIYDEFFEKIKLKDARIRLAINNDGRETEKVSFASAFVNGDPVVFYSTYDLDRRQKLDYLASDVSRKSFELYGYSYIFTVTKEK